MDESIEKFYEYLTKLKKLPRRGWGRRGVEDAESVAEHVFGVAMLSLLTARHLGLSAEKMMAMALLHELCESITGDIIPADGVAKQEKRRREEEATRAILSKVDKSGELVELWLDFEEERTGEGALVKQLDRLEMALQAKSYEAELGLDLGEFVESAREAVSHPDLVKILEAIAVKPRR